ncbi:MAG: hypothetical protein NWF05_02930 [Candidatus Bathyarchaeota archaeon]|nr:hypothetical protein [Candidatus Bathyarchaeota archaeon]
MTRSEEASADGNLQIQVNLSAQSDIKVRVSQRYRLNASKEAATKAISTNVSRLFLQDAVTYKTSSF